MDKVKFNQAIEKFLNKDKEASIGLLQEKGIHSVIKYYLEEDDKYHEVKVCGFVADICKNNFIYEVQTKDFFRLHKKIETYLNDYQVCVVFPIIRSKTIYWISKDGGEVLDKRISPKKGTIYSVLKEMYGLKDFLLNSNLSFKLIFVNSEETRILDGNEKKKSKSKKLDLRPLDIIEEIDVNDYSLFLPQNLPDSFSSIDYSKATKLSKRDSSIALNVLYNVNVIKRIGKDGKRFIYEKTT